MQTYSKFDVVVKVGKYQDQDGKEKNRYHKVGTAFMYFKTSPEGNKNEYDGCRILLDSLPFEKELIFFLSNEKRE